MSGIPLYVALIVMLAAGNAAAQDYQLDGPPPRSAKGEVRTLSSSALSISGKIEVVFAAKSAATPD